MEGWKYVLLVLLPINKGDLLALLPIIKGVRNFKKGFAIGKSQF